ncbi:MULTISPECIES: germination lipoprotein GerS-related protein [unclassified Clostridium]|uniref:germination lipoprotein GerS-related protein n=1 Tax=unclassified Clostridium TaxID=2614128 RepID=UPI00290BE1D8|nr:germination lipoprotein GerS-related protein [Clostridium sp.]MDU5105941.1 germination lipoprotein GerS-related protein [Clostridium sp.]
MKKKLLLIFLVSIPIILITLVVLFRMTAEPTNEEIIKSLKDIKAYKTEVEFLIKNSRDEERQNSIQYYKKDVGGKIDFGEDRTKIYKDNMVLVKDNVANKEYIIENNMNDLYSISFLNKLLYYPINNEGLQEGQEEWGDTEYIVFTSELFLKNDNLDKVKVFIDKQNKIPIGAIIYDKNNKDRVRIVYRNFEKLKELDEELLK